MTDLSEASFQADLVIDRFGGIRPMASKTGIPVTTVQGWKKRGAIPATRIHQITQAARDHGIDLNDLPEAQVANDITFTSPRIVASSDEQAIIVPSSLAPTVATMDKSQEKAAPTPEAKSVVETVVPEQAEMVANETPARVINENRSTRVTWLSLMVLAIAIVVGLLAMGPGVAKLLIQEQRLAAFERELSQLNDQVRELTRQNALLAGVVPEDVKTQIELLADRAQVIEDTVDDLSTQSRALTAGVMGSGDGTIEQRLSKIEEEINQVAEGSEPGQMAAFLTKVQQWQGSADGRKTLSDATKEMKQVIAGAPDFPTMQRRIQDAGKIAPTFKQVIDGLEQDEVRTAILLLSLFDLRASLTQDQVPFQGNISIFRTLLGDTNADLAKDLDRLTPQAKTGVLTSQGLTRKFATMEHDIVAASLESETSFAENMKAKFHNMIKIERGGESVTGTATQKTLVAAEKKLQMGDLAGAITVLQALDGAAAAKAAPFVKITENTLAAHEVAEQITRNISAQISVQPFTDHLPMFKDNASNTQNVMRGLIDSLAVTPIPAH